MKILVLGATGMAGHMISLYLKEVGHTVVGFSRKGADFLNDNVVGDVTDFNKLQQEVLSNQYDAVVNCIGILNSDAENHKSNAVLLNGYLPHFLSDITSNTKTKIIHMSTDCVYSGSENVLFTENQLPNGPTFYDRSKALGEIINGKDLTFRNSIIGPDISKDGIGLFNWFMKQEKPVGGYSSVMWTGVTTLTLAKAIDQALQENLTGLYHLVNNDLISKHDLLVLFNQYFKQNELEIHKNDEVKSLKALYNTRSDFSFVVPSYETMIQEMYDWVMTHQELYPYRVEMEVGE
ncbi:SDR family oxidoreductase [Exiguobacterium sp. 22311]|uniref:SDR family oxidoreductase n=1 Tax=Exiguobacterium sp. 22311 TaxID=3453907 RepID=UPI003F8671F0